MSSADRFSVSARRPGLHGPRAIHFAARVICKRCGAPIDVPLSCSRKAVETYYNFGNAERNFDEADAAASLYRWAVRIDPDRPEISTAMSLALLQMGDWSAAWPRYELRESCREFSTQMQALGKNIWDGRLIPGQRILLVAEQGAGDAIQFIRYGKRLAEAGMIVQVHCPTGVGAIVRRRAMDRWCIDGDATGLRYDMPDHEPATPVRHRSDDNSRRSAVFGGARSSRPAVGAGLRSAGRLGVGRHAEQHPGSLAVLPARDLFSITGGPPASPFKACNLAGVRNPERTAGRRLNRLPRRSPTTPIPPRSSPSWTWLYRWIPRSRISPARSVNRSGCSWAGMPTGVGYSIAPTHRGTRACGFSGPRKNGGWDALLAELARELQDYSDRWHG